MLLLGDSFLFGIFLNESSTISHQLQSWLKEDYEIYNMSVPAWGLDQMYLAYEQYRELLQPDKVIVFYIDDDISRLVEGFFWGAGTKPVFELKGGRLVERDETDGKLNKLESILVFNSQILNRLYKIYCQRKAIPLAQAFFKKWKKEAGDQLSIVHCPRIEEVRIGKGAYCGVLNSFFEKNGFDHYDLSPILQQLSENELKSLYIPFDGHPSEQGTIFFAEHIKAWCFD